MRTVQKSHDIECGILAILITHNNAIDLVCDILKAEHFGNPTYKAIYTELAAQLAKGQDVDVLTLFDALQSTVTLADLNAIAVTQYQSAGAIRSLANHLIDRNKEARLGELAFTIHELATSEAPIRERIDRAQAELAKLTETNEEGEWLEAYESIVKHTELIDQRIDGLHQGMKTGLYDFDEMLDGGLQRGNLVVIGARPAMGKTALAMTIGLTLAENNHVGFISMEMPHQDVRDRQLAILTGIPLAQLKRPTDDLGYAKILDALDKCKTLKFRVTDKSGLNILQIRTKARALKRLKGLDVLIVDYIGLMSGLDAKQPRAYQIEEISRGLKTLAKELDIVVVCLAQVNRGAAERAGQVPGLHDLRDSGAIEQDADVVAFIHRPIAANPDLPAEFNHYAQLRIAKNRQGRTGDVELFYRGDITKFHAWSGDTPKTMFKASKEKL